MLDSGFRGGPDLVSRSAYLGMRELFEHCGAENVFASCSPAHARLYRRSGFSELPGRRAKEGYCLIHGKMDHVLRVAGAIVRPRTHLALVN